MFNFDKQDVWAAAIEFANAIYSITRSVPTDERFGLANQMRRAAVSVSSSIAEGSSRVSRADFARFAEIATGSIFEATSQAFIAKTQGFITESDFQKLSTATEELSKMLSGLRNYLISERK